jgi:hypothetical protein
VKNGFITTYGAARKYDIPLGTLQQHKLGYRGQKNSSGFGRGTAIPKDDELKLATNLKIMTQWGFGLTKSEVMNIVTEFVKRNKLKVPFKNGRPGDRWFKSFIVRYQLSLKKPQAVEFARNKAADPFIINAYFDLLLQILTNNNLMDKPAQVYNLDEFSLSTDPTKCKVAGEINGTGNENTTVLIACNACGEKMPPLIVFKANNILKTWIATQPKEFPHTTYAATQNGWMKTDLFINYLENSFIPNATKFRPILLIYDGHSTHINERVIEVALKNELIILKLPPHSSHLLQPLDLCVFKGLKDAWDQKLATWQRKNVGVKLPKRVFSEFIGEIWNESKIENIKSGFKEGGIYPFNRNVIQNSTYDPAALKRFEAHKKINCS